MKYYVLNYQLITRKVLTPRVRVLITPIEWTFCHHGGWSNRCGSKEAKHINTSILYFRVIRMPHRLSYRVPEPITGYQDCPALKSRPFPPCLSGNSTEYNASRRIIKARSRKIRQLSKPEVLQTMNSIFSIVKSFIYAAVCFRASNI